MHGNIAVKTDNADSHVYGGPCSWFALWTASSAERKAVIWLKRRQFQPYWPRYKGDVKLSRHRHQIRWKGVMPSYIFLPIPIDHEPNWRLIETAPGIRSIKRPDGRFMMLSLNEMQCIQNIEGALNSSALCAAEGIPFKIGQRVKVVNNLYSQWEGPIIAIAKNRKVGIEVNLFGRTTRLDLPASEIEAI